MGIRNPKSEIRNCRPPVHYLLCPALLLCLPFLAALLGGCAQTASPEDFLYHYRRSGPEGTTSGFHSRYTGKDAEYHYLDVRTSTLNRGAWQAALWGPFRDQTLRCPRELLPEEFPTGFWTLQEEGLDDETDVQTREYIRDYLRQRQHAPPKK